MESNKWLTADLFKSAIEAFFKSANVKIVKFDVKPAVPTGDNYTSDITRVRVTFINCNDRKEQEISVIVKCQPRGNLVEKWTMELNFFKTEMEMFGKTLPNIYKILGKESEGCLSPKCLYITEDPNLILVLEDLKPLGYVMSPRRNGFDLDHCLSVVKRMAMLHGASVIMAENDKTSVSKYTKGLFTRDEVSADWIKKGFRSLAETCFIKEGLEKYGRKIKALGVKVVEKGVESGCKKYGGFNVLNHGDLWSNNMMFKYNQDKQLLDTKFIDYQLCKYSSPAVDLHYFYATSPDSNAIRCLPLLLDTYYGNLLSTLASLKYSLEKVPSRNEFIKDFEERAFYGMLGLATVTPLVKASEREDATFDDLAANDGPGSFREHCYTNDVYVKTIEFLLPYYDRLGVMDI